jgi:hypothetical protein
MLKARAACRDERFEKFRVSGDLLEEAESSTTNVFVWMLPIWILMFNAKMRYMSMTTYQVVADSVASRMSNFT